MKPQIVSHSNYICQNIQILNRLPIENTRKKPQILIKEPLKKISTANQEGRRLSGFAERRQKRLCTSLKTAKYRENSKYLNAVETDTIKEHDENSKNAHFVALGFVWMIGKNIQICAVECSILQLRFPSMQKWIMLRCTNCKALSPLYL